MENLHEISTFREKVLLNMVIAGGYKKLSEVTIAKDPVIFNPTYSFSD